MLRLFLIFIGLILLLTGTMVPVLIFSGWALVAVTGIVLALGLLRLLAGAAFAPFVLIAEVVANTRGTLPKTGQNHPQLGDPTYVDWASCQVDCVDPSAFNEHKAPSRGHLLRDRWGIDPAARRALLAQKLAKLRASP